MPWKHRLVVTVCVFIILLTAHHESFAGDDCYQRDVRMGEGYPAYYLFSSPQEQDKDCWFSSIFGSVPAAPRAPVVSSIPAIMLAQPAMAVSPGLMNEALRQRLQREQQDRLAGELREELQKLANALQQPRTTEQTPRAGGEQPGLEQGQPAVSADQRRELLNTASRLKAQISELQEAVRMIESQLNSAGTKPMQ